jgi:hypothetical protein|uniref:BC1881 family protein n=1 Tax=Myoviridae sp. ctSyg22 TaxID=2823545 RepID=A0A8S5L941_9CAUD|nr:MAG TPA: hypothetical protein [Myoviridae sp. ctSyg22]DAP62734.1 MAG TPA: hypothetical protein [Caudoviricetes sp.]
MNIKEIPTCELVEELAKREGVEKIEIEPYKVKIKKLEGPMIVLKIID